MKNLIGSTIGQHEIVEQLGRGGMANVYKGFHPGLAVHRAIKVIRPDLADTEGFRDRFQREARAVAALRHPNIVQVHDFGQQDDLFYMVMEYVEGEDLKSRMIREGAIRPFSEAVRLIEQIGAALAYAHERGVVHRDIKPDNVLLDDKGQAILADFGIAKIIEADDAKLTATGTGLGTPAYMAPEQARGSTDVGDSADLYALGVVLYEMLTARLPFAADTPLAVLQRVIHDPVTPPREFTADIPDPLQGVVLKAMAKNPADRYPDVPALVEAAKQSLLGLGPETAAAATPVAVPPPPPAPSATPVTTDGGTVVLDDTGAPVTLPVEDQQAVTPAGRSARSSRGPLLAAVAVLLVLVGLAGATVAFGVWWFGREAPDENDLLTTFNELTEPGGGFADPARDPGSEPELPASLDERGDLDPTAAMASDSVGVAAEAERESSTRTGPSSRATSGTPDSNAQANVQGAVGQGAAASSSGPADAGGAGVEGDTSDPGARSTSAPSRSSPSSQADDGWRNRRRSAETPIPTAPQAAGARLLGRTRFGSTFRGEVEPEQPVAIEIEVKRPTTFYFDVTFANQLAACKMLAPDGSVVFANAGGDEGPLQVDQRGIYTVLIETDGGVPIQFDVTFRQIGS